MTLPANRRAGPLGEAIAHWQPARKSNPPVSAKKLVERGQDAASSSDPVRALASLLDFSGSMNLAEVLSAPLPAPQQNTPADSGLLKRLRHDIDFVRTRAVRPFRDPLQSREGLPEANRAREILDHAHAWSGDPSCLNTAAEQLWTPLADLLSSRVQYARAALGDLRVELGPQLNSLGSVAAELETLDRVLMGATRDRLDKLFARVVPSLEACFFEEFAHEVNKARQENTPPSARTLQEWFEGDGFYVRQVRMARRFVLAVVEFEADRMVALVQACERAVDD